MGGIYENLSGAKGLRAEGRSAQNIAEYNAQVAEQEAKAARLKTAFEQRRQAKAGERVRSALRARVGAAAGGEQPLLEAAQAAELELENLLIGYEGEVAARRAESQAELDRLQGELARQKGKAAARRANIQFGLQTASLLTGFGGFGGGRKPQQPTSGPGFRTSF